MKFGFYVSKKATRLKNFIEYINSDNGLNKYLDDIKFVYRDSELKDEISYMCNKNGIKLYQCELKSFSKDERSQILSNELLTIMKENKVEYLFVFGSRLLKGDILKEYKNRIINFHPSLLPAFPGIKSIDKAMEYGSFVIGNTAHFIDEGIDTGQIIMQNIFVINGKINYDEILDQQIPMLLQLMIWLKEDRIIADNRRVLVKNAKYELGNYVPNLEVEWPN